MSSYPGFISDARTAARALVSADEGHQQISWLSIISCQPIRRNSKMAVGKDHY